MRAIVCTPNCMPPCMAAWCWRFHRARHGQGTTGGSQRFSLGHKQCRRVCVRGVCLCLCVTMCVWVGTVWVGPRPNHAVSVCAVGAGAAGGRHPGCAGQGPQRRQAWDSTPGVFVCVSVCAGHYFPCWHCCFCSCCCCCCSCSWCRRCW